MPGGQREKGLGGDRRSVGERDRWEESEGWRARSSEGKTVIHSIIFFPLPAHVAFVSSH